MWICLLLLLLATVVSKMAKISSPNGEYPIKPDPEAGDKVIGTDVTDGSTKNFTVQGIADFVTGGDDIVSSVTGPGAVKANPTTGNVVVDLQNLAGGQPGDLVPGTYELASVTVDQYGRVTGVANGAVSGGVDSLNGESGEVILLEGTNIDITSTPGSGVIQISAPNLDTGTVTEVDTGTGLTGGPITTTGTISLADQPDLTPGSYTNADIVVDAQGRILEASNGDGAPDQDLQDVLDTGNTADGSIALTGVGNAITAVNGNLIVKDIDWSNVAVGETLQVNNEIYLAGKVKDNSASEGFDGAILVKDDSVDGVVWQERATLSTRLFVPAATIATMGPSTGPDVVPNPGVNKAVMVVSASISYANGTTPYGILGDFQLAVGSGVQATSPSTPLQVIANDARVFTQAPAPQLVSNLPLKFVLGGAVTDPGDGNIQIEVVYRVVELLS